jgi:nitric oxide synthase oxygenase domain/subunit
VRQWRKYMQRKKEMQRMWVLVMKQQQMVREMGVRDWVAQLRIEKERGRWKVMRHALEEDLEKAIERHRQGIVSVERAVSLAQTRRAVSIVAHMAARRLFSYFNHWSKQATTRRSMLLSKVIDHLNAWFYRRLNVGF